MIVLGLSWGGLVVVGVGVAALAMFVLGLAAVARDEVLDVEDPEDRWAREARERAR